MSAMQCQSDPGPAVGPAGALIDRILATHHTTARRLMDEMEAALLRMEQAGDAPDPRLRELVGALVAEMRAHMDREEQVLFPFIRELEALPEVSEADTGALLSPIVCMKREHGFIDELLDALRTTCGDYVVEAGCGEARAALLRALSAFADDTRAHVEIENERLFPMAMEMAPPVR